MFLPCTLHNSLSSLECHKALFYSIKISLYKLYELKPAVITQAKLTSFLSKLNSAWMSKIFTFCTYTILTLILNQLNKCDTSGDYVLLHGSRLKSIRSLNWFLSCSLINSSFFQNTFFQIFLSSLYLVSKLWFSFKILYKNRLREGEPISIRWVRVVLNPSSWFYSPSPKNGLEMSMWLSH